MRSAITAMQANRSILTTRRASMSRERIAPVSEVFRLQDARSSSRPRSATCRRRDAATSRASCSRPRGASSASSSRTTPEVHGADRAASRSCALAADAFRAARRRRHHRRRAATQGRGQPRQPALRRQRQATRRPASSRRSTRRASSLTGDTRDRLRRHPLRRTTSSSELLAPRRLRRRGRRRLEGARAATDRRQRDLVGHLGATTLLGKVDAASSQNVGRSASEPTSHRRVDRPAQRARRGDASACAHRSTARKASPSSCAQLTARRCSTAWSRPAKRSRRLHATATGTTSTIERPAARAGDVELTDAIRSSEHACRSRPSATSQARGFAH